MGLKKESPAIVYIGYVGGLGGEAGHILLLASGMARRGRRTRLIVPDLPKVRASADVYLSPEERADPNLEVVYTPLIKFDTGAQNPANVLRLLTPYRDTPVLHLHTGDICLPRMTIFALELMRPKNAIATIHCHNVEMTPGGSRARLWEGCVRRCLRRVISPSQRGRKTQLGYGLAPEKTLVIYSGVNASRFVRGDGAGPRAMLGVGPETPLIVYAARLYSQKRPLDAVATFAQVAVRRPDARFVLIGSGPLETDVEQAIDRAGLRDRTYRLPLQPNIPDWLAAANVWLFPTESENFSMATLEALTAGCPLVSTYCPGNDEILRPGENAFALPVGDTAGMAEAICQLLTDSALRGRLSDAGRAAAAGFTTDIMVERHLKLYDSL